MAGKRKSLILDIHSTKDYPANVLSNFYPHRFTLDGISIACMEGFLQSTKCPDPEYRKVICRMDARQAKDVGQTFHWQENGLLYWNGRSFSRYGPEYRKLLRRAYGALCDVPEFRQAILHTGSSLLGHSIGKWSRKETCLTTWEFLLLLYWCRTRLKRNFR